MTLTNRSQRLYVFWCLFWQSVFVAGYSIAVMTALFLPPRDGGASILVFATAAFLLIEAALWSISIGEAEAPEMRGWALVKMKKSFSAVEEASETVMELLSVDKASDVRAELGRFAEVLRRASADEVK
jgi:hypothetical protein